MAFVTLPLLLIVTNPPGQACARLPPTSGTVLFCVITGGASAGANSKGESYMAALKQVSSLKHFHKFFLLLLVGILILTSSASAQAQGETPGSWQKSQPAEGEKSAVPGVEGLQPLTSPNLVPDPSFELSYSSGAHWSQSSYMGIPVLCTTADCG